MSIVHCKLPKAGLGNQMFALMKAFLFGHLHDLPVVVTGYHQFQPGPYLRRERSKRRYADYFVFQKSFFGEKWDEWKIRNIHFSEYVQEPDLNSNVSKNGKVLYEFSLMPSWEDYFKHLKDHRQLVCKLLHELINEKIKEELERQTKPWIGVHIRMGDFRKMKEGEDFSKLGMVRTPETYFIHVIEKIRAICQDSVPVSVFTNGRKHEFETLFSVPGVTMIQGNRDITDMLLLSRSEVVVTSAGSSFSYWAGFLSNAPIIMHPDDISGALRLPGEDHFLYEGPVESLLKSHLGNHSIIEKNN